MGEIEQERKFLLKRLPQGCDVLANAGGDVTKFGLMEGYVGDIFQYYYSNNERYRMIYRGVTNVGYYKTIKHKIAEGVYNEHEVLIADTVFFNLLKNDVEKKYIHKIRYTFYYKDLKFEVDQFLDMNLVILEVELKDMNQQIVFPENIEKELLCDITSTGLTNLKIAETLAGKDLYKYFVKKFGNLEK